MRRPVYPSRASFRSRHSADEVSTLDEFEPTTLEVPEEAIARYLAEQQQSAEEPGADEPPPATSSGANHPRALGSPADLAPCAVLIGLGLGLGFGSVLALLCL